MSSATIGRWGNSLAIRLPREVIAGSGLSDGEQVAFETRDGEIVIRLLGAESARDALAAAEEINAESEHHSLGMSIRELLDEGRRG